MKFLDNLLKELVTKPKDIKITETKDDMGILLEVSCNPKDIGIIIGKSGRNAVAIRTLLAIIGAKNKARYNLRILQPEEQNGRKNNKSKL